jgi:hypothetical protein
VKKGTHPKQQQGSRGEDGRTDTTRRGWRSGDEHQPSDEGDREHGSVLPASP